MDVPKRQALIGFTDPHRVWASSFEASTLFRTAAPFAMSWVLRSAEVGCGIRRVQGARALWGNLQLIQSMVCSRHTSE
jgi:hypothetical protein